MNGRIYDYNIGRFMSVDPFIQSPTSTQSVNPYSYIMNNPLAGTDPTGYTAKCEPNTPCSEEKPLEPVNEEKTETSNGQNNEKRNSDRDSRSASKVGTFATNRIVSHILGTSGSPNVGLDNETSEQISTFEGRAELYNQMQGMLDEAGIDTVWFGVAGELNDFFAQQETALKIGDFFTVGDTHDYLNDLGIDLYDKNKAAFNDLMSGAIDIRGQKLDNFLVRREQGFVESYTVKRFGMNAPASSRILLNSTFIAGRQLMPNIMQKSLQYIDKRHNGKFNFFNTYHRIELGQAMMSQARHVR